MIAVVLSSERINLMGYQMDISVGRGYLLISRLETRICLNIDVPKITFDNRFQNLLLSPPLLVNIKEKKLKGV